MLPLMPPYGRNIRLTVTAVALACGLVSLSVGPVCAQAIDLAIVEKVIGFIQKIAGALDSNEDHSPDVAALIEQSTNTIINEIRAIRNEGLDATIEAILWNHRERLTNPNRPFMDEELNGFFKDSLNAIIHMKRIIDSDDYQSAYHFTTAFNVMIAVRVAAMKSRPTWFMQADFDNLYNYWLQGNHRLVGARQVELRPCLFSPSCVVDTVSISQAWASLSDYWFDSPFNCRCNVHQNKCTPFYSDQDDTCQVCREVWGGWGWWLGDKCEVFSPAEVIDGERYRIWFNKYTKDGSVRVAQAAIEQLLGFGFNSVNSLIGQATILGL